MPDIKSLPRHIAIIMDGNGRWARKRGLPVAFGHKAGAKAVDVVTELCAKSGIEALTLYSFSTENWKRSKKEVDALMGFLSAYLDKKYNKLMANSIRLNAIGKLQELPVKARDKLYDVMKRTSKNNRMVLTLALNYGARQEIAEAARRIASEVKKGKLDETDITEELFAEFLYTKGLPDVDLLIRTSGEMRVSNFLLWQISYAEIVITKTLWPDFNKTDLDNAIIEYQKRQRRFGAR